MTRTLRILMRRDPSRDRHESQTYLEGYAILWPDGRPLGVGFDAFCNQGLRLFGLGRHLCGCREKLLDLIYYPLAGIEDGLTRVPGHRVRRFFLLRGGRHGRLHFFNGAPTGIVLDLDRDEPLVLNWIGLPSLRDGEAGWFDLAARPANLWPEHKANGSIEATVIALPPATIRNPHTESTQPLDSRHP